jgi:hypothetical protein
MNPLIVEKAVADALKAEALENQTIYLGSDFVELDPQSLNIIVSVDHIESAFSAVVISNETSQTGSSRLYMADLVVRLESPALLGSSAMDALGVAIGNVSSSIDASYFIRNWPESSAEFTGISYSSTDKSVSGNQWVIEIRASLGVSIITPYFQPIPLPDQSGE